MKTHLSNFWGWTECGLSDEFIDWTLHAKDVTCKNCKKTRAYKNLNQIL